MERTPGRREPAVPLTPRRPSEVQSRLPIRTPQTKTPRTSLLALEERENIPLSAHVLPRNKPVDEVARLAEARIEDLRAEKHALQNEREDLRTEIQLGRQRELKMRAQIEKQDAMLARYKERAAHMSKTYIQQRAFDEAQAKRLQAETEAEASAARCAELADQLTDLQEQQEVEELLQHNMRCVANAAGKLAGRAMLSRTPHSAPTPVYFPTLPNNEPNEYLECLQAQRDALVLELDDAHAHARHMQQHCDTLEEELALVHTSAEWEEERVAAAQLAEQCTATDATWYLSKLHMAEDRCTWLESQLAHTHAVHSQVLAALRAQERRHTEAMHTQLATARDTETQLRADIARLEEALSHVAWYEEAYVQRSRQADLLTELATLADTDARARRIESLSTHIDALHSDMDTLRSRRDQLEAYHAQWERGLAGLDSNPIKRRRAVSDAGQYGSWKQDSPSSARVSRHQRSF